MLFNSFEFVFFLPIVFILYWFVFNNNIRLQNFFIVVASYIFYGWWDWRFLILIALTTIVSYFSGRLIEKYDGNRFKQRFVSTVNIVFNLAILCIFKYYNFFVENLQLLCRSIGFEVDWVTLDLLLPVGISFYTFQALSYSIDIYQKKMSSCKDILAFFAYISFFPQLVAGPIERATNLLPQFYVSRIFDYNKAIDGCRQILWGFFKKMVIADNCATLVNSIWSDYSNQDGMMLLLGGLLFTFQIYGDFSGYSDIAIGTARLFGINLMRNFDFPYFSRDIAEFWRKWHISLTTWFRDYIYIPLGGSRCVKWKVMRNTMIIFLVSGFWHGANWTFIVWGFYHALLFFPLMLLGKNRKYTNSIAQGRIFPSLVEVFQMLITFFLVVIGWIIFRAENIHQALEYVTRMFVAFDWSLPATNQLKIFWALIWVIVLIIVEWLQRDKQHALQIPLKGCFRYTFCRWSIYCILIFVIYVFAGKQETFIYFQF